MINKLTQSVHIDRDGSAGLASSSSGTIEVNISVIPISAFGLFDLTRYEL